MSGVLDRLDDQGDMLAADVVLPISARSVLRRPKYSGPGKVEVLPLLFWLLEASRPRLHVTLGAFNRAAFFGVCQALDYQGAGSQCFAFVDKGAATDIAAYAEEHYYGLTTVLPETDTADERFKDQSIDSLHIDLDPAGMAEGDLIGTVRRWKAKLSDRAVIVLHGVRTFGSSAAIGDALAGLLRPGATSYFDLGDGGLIILSGDHQPTVLRRLVALNQGDEGYADVRHIFARLGQMTEGERSARTLIDRVGAVSRELELTAKERATALAEKAALEAELTKFGLVQSERAGKVAELQSMLFDLRTAADSDAARAADDRQRDARKIAELEESLMLARSQSDAREAERAELAERLKTTEFQAASANEAAAVRLEALEQSIEAAHKEMVETLETRAALANANDVERTGLAEKLNDLVFQAASEKEAAALRIDILEQSEAAHREKIEALEVRAALASRLERELAALNRNGSQKDKIDALEASLASRFVEIAALTRRLDERDRACERIKRDFETIENELRSCEREKASLNEQIQLLTRRVAESGEALSAERHALSLMTERVDKHRAHISKMRASKSWRWTAPIRKIGK